MATTLLSMADGPASRGSTVSGAAGVARRSHRTASATASTRTLPRASAGLLALLPVALAPAALAETGAAPAALAATLLVAALWLFQQHETHAASAGPIKVRGVARAKLVMLVLPALAAVALGRSFLVMALLALICERLADHQRVTASRALDPAARRLLGGLFWAAALTFFVEAGSLASGVDAGWMPSVGAGLLGLLTALTGGSAMSGSSAGTNAAGRDRSRRPPLGPLLLTLARGCAPLALAGLGLAWIPSLPLSEPGQLLATLLWLGGIAAGACLTSRPPAMESTARRVGVRMEGLERSWRWRSKGFGSSI